MPDLARVIREDLRPDAEETRKRLGGCLRSFLCLTAITSLLLILLGIAVYRSLKEDRTSARSARIIDLRWRRSFVLERRDGDGAVWTVVKRLESSGRGDAPRRWPSATPAPNERIGQRVEVFLVSLRTEGEDRPLLYTTVRYENIKGLKLGQTVTIKLTPGTRLCVKSLTASP